MPPSPEVSPGSRPDSPSVPVPPAVSSHQVEGGTGRVLIPVCGTQTLLGLGPRAWVGSSFPSWSVILGRTDVCSGCGLQGGCSGAEGLGAWAVLGAPRLLVVTWAGWGRSCGRSSLLALGATLSFVGSSLNHLECTFHPIVHLETIILNKHIPKCSAQCLFFLYVLGA